MIPIRLEKLVKSKINLLSLGISSVLLLFIHLFAYPYVYASGYSNILYYAFLSIVFLISVLIIHSTKLNDYCNSILKNNRIVCVVVAVFLCLAWFVIMFFSEKKIYGYLQPYCFRHSIFPVLYFALVLIICSSFYFLFKLRLKHKRIRLIPALIIAIIQSAVLFAPNLINDRGGTLYHIHAFMNPILNSERLVPISRVTMSIYGKYHLFYIIPLKILKLSGLPVIYCAMLITGIICFISFGLLYIGLNKLIERDVLFYVSVLAVAFISFSTYASGQYYQMIPLRIVFPAVSVFLFAFFRNKDFRWILLIVPGIATLWNFETGIVCSISLLIVGIWNGIERDNYKKIILSYCSAAVGSVLISYLFLNLINIIMGGGFVSPNDYIFPIGSKSFKIEDLSLKLPGFFSMYYLETLVFLSLCYYYIQKRVIEKSRCYSDGTMIGVSIMGLGLMVYFYNRPSFANVSISHIPFVVVLILMIEIILTQTNNTNYKKLFYGSQKLTVFIICMLILTFFCLDTIVGIPITVRNRIDTVWNMQSYKDLVAIIQNQIPQSTPAAGVGLPDIYSSMGRNEVICVSDWADWQSSEEAILYVKETISNCDSLFVDYYGEVLNYINPEEWLFVTSVANEFTYIVRIDYDKKKAIIKYANEHQLSDVEFIKFVYLNFMQYYPDAETTSELTMALETGVVDKTEIVNRFSDFAKENEDIIGFEVEHY